MFRLFKKELPSSHEEYVKSYDKVQRNTLGLIFFFLFLASATFVSSFSISRSLFPADSLTDFQTYLVIFSCFLISALIFTITLFTWFAYTKRFAGATSLKTGTFMLKNQNLVSEKILWKKITKKLNPEELETFKTILPSFEGSIEDLIVVSKDCAKV